MKILCYITEHIVRIYIKENKLGSMLTYGASRENHVSFGWANEKIDINSIYVSILDTLM